MRHKTVFIFRDGAYKFSQKCFFFTLRKRKLQLGELIMVQGRLPNETDWDTLTKTGMYYVSGFNTSYVNFPTGAYLYGILLVFNPVPFGVMQVYSPDNEDYPYIYARIKNTNWNKWVKFTGMAI